jgi:hypothetical protein
VLQRENSVYHYSFEIEPRLPQSALGGGIVAACARAILASLSRLSPQDPIFFGPSLDDRRCAKPFSLDT